MRVWAGLVLLLGCSQRPLDLPGLAAAGADLSFPDQSFPDLSFPDLSQPAVAFCAGTAVAGTCLQGFFAPLAACFDAVGSCTTNGIVPTHYCWNNGAHIVETFNDDQTETFDYFSSSGTKCFTSQLLPGGGAIVITVGGETITWDLPGGHYLCSGASTQSVGPNCGGCAELCALLEASMGCVTGKCP